MGISLNLDIIKAHGGELSVTLTPEKIEAKVTDGLAGEKAGTVFIFSLPVI